MPGCFGVISLSIVVLAASERSSERAAITPEYHELQEPIPAGIDWFKPTVREISQGGVLHDAVHNVKKAADLMKSVAGNVVDALHAHENTVVEAKAHLDKTNLLSDELPKHILTELMLKDDSRMKSMNDALKGVFPAETDEMEDHPTVSLSEHEGAHAEEGALGKELEEEDEHVHQQDEELDREEHDTDTETGGEAAGLGFGDVVGMAVGAGEGEGAAEKAENMEFPQPPPLAITQQQNPDALGSALGQPQVNAFGPPGAPAFTQQPHTNSWGSALGQSQPHNAFGQIAMPVQPQLLIDPASGHPFLFNSYTGQAQWAATPAQAGAQPAAQQTYGGYGAAASYNSQAGAQPAAQQTYGGYGATASYNSQAGDQLHTVVKAAQQTHGGYGAAASYNSQAEPHASVNRRTLALTGAKAGAFQRL